MDRVLVCRVECDVLHRTKSYLWIANRNLRKEGDVVRFTLWDDGTHPSPSRLAVDLVVLHTQKQVLQHATRPVMIDDGNSDAVSETLQSELETVLVTNCAQDSSVATDDLLLQLHEDRPVGALAMHALALQCCRAYGTTTHTALNCS